MPPPVAEPFLVIAGPTASGKSEFAVRVAERCGGEIVGGDAFQIYAGRPILTAQPAAEMRARVPHWLIGEVPLTERFDVAQYLEAARRRIAEIHRRGKLAIVCGGTGLYLRALLRGLADLPAADASLRAELEAQPLAELQRRLAALDPQAAAQVDRQNPRRVIRALEVCLLTGRPFSSYRDEWAVEDTRIRGVVLAPEREALHRRIASRTAAMFAAGVVEEVRALGVISETAELAIGVREIRAHLAGQMTREDCQRQIEEATRQYAKRQATWFRRETNLRPLPLGAEAPDDDCIARALAWSGLGDARGDRA